jgi:general secretion pathway protein K
MSTRALNRRRDAGFALIIVLWTLGLLALIGTQILASGRSDAQMARNLLDNAELEAATNGAIQQAIFRLIDRSDRRWLADGAEHVTRVGSATIEIRVDDEGGKVNPNIASEALLQALLLRVGANGTTAASLAAAILDWRTSGTQPRPHGAKAAQYLAAGRDYGPPGTDFVGLDELRGILGMTPELLARLEPHMTVFSDSDPDGTTKDQVVAAALADLGRKPRPTTTVEDAQIVSITARSVGPTGARFAERVVVGLTVGAGPRPYEMLAITRLPSER